MRIDRNRRRLVLNRIALVVCRHPNVLRRSQRPVALRNTRTLAYDKRVDHRLRRPALLKECYRNPETGTIGQATCNLYSITTNQEAITRLFRVMNRYIGSLWSVTMTSGDFFYSVRGRGGTDHR